MLVPFCCCFCCVVAVAAALGAAVSDCVRGGAMRILSKTTSSSELSAINLFFFPRGRTGDSSSLSSSRRLHPAPGAEAAERWASCSPPAAAGAVEGGFAAGAPAAEGPVGSLPDCSRTQKRIQQITRCTPHSFLPFLQLRPATSSCLSLLSECRCLLCLSDAWACLSAHWAAGGQRSCRYVLFLPTACKHVSVSLSL